MPDIFSKEKRSEVMSLIRSKHTVAEKLTFSYLRKNGVYFQKHYSKTHGTPDIALPRKKKAVFIDSEFWHGKTYEKLAKTRDPDDFWVKKLPEIWNEIKSKEMRCIQKDGRFSSYGKKILSEKRQRTTRLKK